MHRDTTSGTSPRLGMEGSLSGSAPSQPPPSFASGTYMRLICAASFHAAFVWRGGLRVCCGRCCCAHVFKSGCWRVQTPDERKTRSRPPPPPPTITSGIVLASLISQCGRLHGLEASRVVRPHVPSPLLRGVAAASWAAWRGPYAAPAPTPRAPASSSWPPLPATIPQWPQRLLAPAWPTRCGAHGPVAMEGVGVGAAGAATECPWRPPGTRCGPLGRAPPPLSGLCPCRTAGPGRHPSHRLAAMAAVRGGHVRGGGGRNPLSSRGAAGAARPPGGTASRRLVGERQRAGPLRWTWPRPCAACAVCVACAHKVHVCSSVHAAWCGHGCSGCSTVGKVAGVA
jgi:hypothetical protein